MIAEAERELDRQVAAVRAEAGIEVKAPFNRNDYTNGGYITAPNKPKTNQKGVIKYDVYVNEAGTADKVHITKSSGNPKLDELVKQTAYQEKYKAKTINGSPVKTFYKLSAEFK